MRQEVVSTPVSERQLYYAARKAFKDETGRELRASYFSQTLLVQYLNSHSVDWKITADPRGTLSIPNASHEVRIQVGTIAIDEHLRSTRCELMGGLEIGRLPTEWPSLSAGQRYGAVLYIEKEGFEPLLKEARIAERFDLAILSCKGQSVVAARKFVDQVCSVGSGVPLFIVHDFDKAGFEIAQCLTQVSEAAANADRVQYRFKNKINVVDFGLRLKDVQKYDLATEEYETRFGYNAPEAMTKDEVEFMKNGERVELNAFTAPQFIEWIESKLTKHLPKN